MNRRCFSIFHPLHVVLSAMVTAALFEIHRKAKSFLLILIVGIVGSIGIATLSDSILPFFRRVDPGRRRADSCEPARARP